MDIRNKADYPYGVLAPFAYNVFFLDGVRCNSLEGFLYSLQVKKPQVQAKVCLLTGLAAHDAAKGQDFYRTQTCHWGGIAFKRDGPEYQDLLDRVFIALGKNADFCEALLATGCEPLTFCLGRQSQRKTMLTEREFIPRLLRLRLQLSG